MHTDTLETSELFMVPAGQLAGEEDEALWLVYSPLTGQSLMCDRGEAEQVRQRLASVVNGTAPQEEVLYALLAQEKKEALLARRTELSHIRRLCILANQRCNFTCSYCYSARGRSKAELSYAQMMTAFEWFYTLEREKGTILTVAFIGGGEPMLSWDSISRCIERMAERAQADEVPLHFLIITNGSLINDKHIDFLKKYKVNVQVSFEVIPEIQNSQRGQYERVHANLLHMQERGLRFSLRAVITELNLERMSEMVQLTAQHYPSVKSLRLEPVIDGDYLRKEAAKYYDRFYTGFTQALEAAKPYGLELTCTDYGSADMLRTHFCGPQAVLTPKGLISSCEFESDETDGHFENYLYGGLTDSGMELRHDAFESIYPKVNKQLPEACLMCWARWNCGGGCKYRREQMGEEVFSHYCNFTRRLLLYTLVQRLRKQCVALGLPDPLAVVKQKP